MASVILYYRSLNRFSDYPAGENEACIYEFKRLPALSEIFAQYDICGIAGNGDTMSKARKVMQWIADNTSYNGGSPLGPSLPDKILDFAVREKNPINCANRAILFSDMLTYLGIFAFPVWLLHRPYDGQKGELMQECHCHVIVQVWLSEKECWESFDPSFNTYFTVSRGREVNIPEMARMARKVFNARSIDNVTGKRTGNGSVCAQIGLLQMSILPGNDFCHRYRGDEMLNLLPDSYVAACKELTENYGIPDLKRITVSDMTGKPHWAETKE